nr:hypothetical protein [Tanacetum cinerariifolium]
MVQTLARNHAQRGNHQHYARMTLLNPQRHVVPTEVLTQSKLVPITAVKPVTVAIPKINVTRPTQAKTIVTRPHSQPKRHINRSPSPKVSNSLLKVNAVKASMVNAVKGVQGKWEWKPKCPILDHVPDIQHALKDKRVIDSGCSRHMIGNMSCLSDFEEINGGYVAFGGNPKGGFEDPDYPDKVYKVVKALYGLHQAPRAWYETLANYLLENDSCKAFEKLMKDKFQMSSMGELTFFLGLQVKQKPDGIFISQNKYVAETLRKFGLTDGKSASAPIDTRKPLLEDPDGEDVDVHTYRSMISSLMFLTSSRPDIMFAGCACAHFHVTLKALHLHAVKKIFRYLKGKPHLSLWYPKDLPFNLVAYSDSVYTGASLDRKSTTGGCQFLGCRLISWQCKKQTVVATSSTKADFGLTMQVAKSNMKSLKRMLYVTNILSAVSLTTPPMVLNSPCLTHIKNWLVQIKRSLKKVIITKATIRDALRLADAEGIDCLPNEEIFTELSRIGAQVDDLSSHSIKYSSSALTQKVFANMRRVGKGCSGVETPLFKGMIVAQQVGEGAVDVNVKDVLADGVADEDTCTTLTRRVENLEEDKITQALEITKLKERVKKLEGRSKLKVSKLRRLKKVGTTQRIDTSKDTIMDDVSKQGRIIANMDADEHVILQDVADNAKEVVVDAEIKDDADVLSMQDEESEPTELQEVVEVVTTTKLITEVLTTASDTITAADTPIPAATIIVAAPTLNTTHSAARRRKEVVIRDHEETTTPSTIIHTKPKSKDKGKGIMVHEPKPLKKKTKIEQDEAYAREGMSYDDIRLIFEKKFNSNVAFLKKTKERMKEEDSRALKRKVKSSKDKAAKKKRMDEDVEELRRHLQIVPNDDDDVYTEAIPLALKKRLGGSMELVKERFASTKPKNFSDDFLLTTLGAMFEKPDVQAQIWRNQRSVHGLAKVKSWKLLESCSVQIITFTTTQLILLVERKYPLTRFTLDQMLNNVRLAVEEESKVSLELMRKYAKGLRLLVKDLMLPSQVDVVGQKQNMEDTMLELLEGCRQKEIYCMHNDVEDLIESALNSKLLLINLKSQPLDKEKQEVKNIVEQAPKRRTRLTMCLKNFKVIHNESIIPLNNTPQISSVIAIAPVLPTEEPDNSLSMEDEHLSTILEIELDEVIKSSVKNLVPILSESEVTSDNENECDVPVNDESSLIFTNTLIDSSPKFDFLLEEFSGELAHIYPIPPQIKEADFDLEEEIHLVENFDSQIEEIDLFLAMDDLMPPGIENEDYDSERDIHFLKEFLSSDPLPLLENESSNFDHHDDSLFPFPPPKPQDVEVFFYFKPDTGVLITKVVEDISEHYVLMPKVLPSQPTLCPNIDTLLSFLSKNEDKVFKPGILSYLLVSHQDKIIFDFSESPMMIFGEDIPLLDVSIAPDLEASRAGGFVHRLLEFQSLVYGNPISEILLI